MTKLGKPPADRRLHGPAFIGLTAAVVVLAVAVQVGVARVQAVVENAKKLGLRVITAQRLALMVEKLLSIRPRRKPRAIRGRRVPLVLPAKRRRPDRVSPEHRVLRANLGRLARPKSRLSLSCEVKRLHYWHLVA